MASLFDIQFEVECFMKERHGNKGITLWEELVESSRQLDGAGCDGILMSEVENHTESLLSRTDNREMYEIWKETENGIMAIEQGFDEPQKSEMIHDICIDVHQAIVDTICQEARETMRKKGRQKRA